MPDDLTAELLVWERRVWDALVAGDKAADAALIHPDFLGVYSDGFAGRNLHAGQLDDGPTVDRYRLSDARCRAVGPDHALLSYRADFRRVGKAKDEVMYVSSLWKRDGDGWVNVFSQDTPGE
ncbi:MAG: nuclear transport factor 2 family protein [Alphaproteobacteria bacterium]